MKEKAKTQEGAAAAMKVQDEEEPCVLHAGLRAGGAGLLGRSWPCLAGGGGELATYAPDVEMFGAIIIVLSSMVVTVANYLQTELRVPRITSIILDSIKRLW